MRRPLDLVYMTHLRRFLIGLWVLAFLGAASFAQESEFALEPVADGFERPLLATHAGDGSGRLFVVEQGGQIHIVQDGARLDEPFLNVGDLITTGGNEQGLLGLAFHPDYPVNGQLYLYYTAPGGDSVIANYQVSDDPNVADEASGRELLRFAQPYSNHNGGHLAFGPDGMLYVGTGDGGSGGDPENSGQSLDTYLGKLLRLDVDSGEPYAVPADNPFVDDDAVLDEIWAYGLRNPWRFSFDRDTGDLFIGDVGQNAVEEISFQAASSTGGENYGWNMVEGDRCFRDGCDLASFTAPILTYDHSQGRSVTGGYVYRGADVPALQGRYLYADLNGNIWAAELQGDSWTAELASASGLTVTSFGEDEAGELYLTDFASGTVYKFAPN